MKTLCSHAFYHNYDGLIFFDQDTVFNEMTLETIHQFYYNHQKMLKDAYSSVVFNSENYIVNKEINYQNYKNVILSRNSGSLFILNNLEKMNWHNTSYFVDGVDYEYNLRSQLNNYKIAEFPQTPGFDHITEQVDIGYKILGYTLPFGQYPNSRIKDYFVSNIKVFSKAFFNYKFIFFKQVFVQFIIYIISQILIKLKIAKRTRYVSRCE